MTIWDIGYGPYEIGYGIALHYNLNNIPGIVSKRTRLPQKSEFSPWPYKKPIGGEMEKDSHERVEVRRKLNKIYRKITEERIQKLQKIV